MIWIAWVITRKITIHIAIQCLDVIWLTNHFFICCTFETTQNMLTAVAYIFLWLCVNYAQVWTAWAMPGLVLFVMYISIPITKLYSHLTFVFPPSLSDHKDSNTDRVELGSQSIIPVVRQTFVIGHGWEGYNSFSLQFFNFNTRNRQLPLLYLWILKKSLTKINGGRSPSLVLKFLTNMFIK